MNSKDLSLLSEAYQQVQQNQTLEEGPLSQFAAKAGAAKDALVQGVKNVAHVASGKGGNVQDEKGRQGTLPSWKKTYETSKRDRIVQSLTNSIIDDIKGMELFPAGFEPSEQDKEWWSDVINTYIDNYKAQVTKSGRVSKKPFKKEPSVAYPQGINKEKEFSSVTGASV